VEDVRSQCRRLQDGLVVYVAEVLVVIQYNVLVVTSGDAFENKVIRSFIIRGCSNPVISTGHTSVDIGASVMNAFVEQIYCKHLRAC